MTPIATGHIWLRYGIVNPLEWDGDGPGRYHLGHHPRRLLAGYLLEMREPGQLRLRGRTAGGASPVLEHRNGCYDLASHRCTARRDA
jgi:hypothetical protein